MSVDYGTLRHTVAAQLRTAIAAAAVVYDEEPGDLGSASPILVVLRRGRSRAPLTLRDKATRAQMAIHAYFLASEAPDGSYTYADGADAIDQVATQLDAWIDANQSSADGGWKRITEDGESTIEFGVFNDDGIPRFREIRPLTFECY